MRKYYLILSVVILSLLTACRTPVEDLGNSSSVKISKEESQSDSAKSSKKAEDTKQTQNSDNTTEAFDQSSQSEESDSSNHKQASDASFNGSYYSAQGKYGAILIVNKKHPLSSSYNPGENLEASSAFQRLLADMQALGYPVSSQYSGFRSYDTQAGLYQSYVNQDGRANADRYSARAGYSEHQTGLAYDLIDSSGALLTDSSATAWLANNAHNYGFIVRYLPGKEAITGYMAESWHIRYIGQEAKDIYQSGLTLEEYLGVEGGDYPN